MPKRLSSPISLDRRPVDLAELRERAKDCTACELYKHATQTVFGEGPQNSRVMMIGEQPGDQEDRQGRPFVGPAGTLLDRGLGAVGIDRSQVYVTNIVKHFKWEPRGKRRIHKKPSALEVSACRPWLDAELESIRPQVVVLLGATVAQSLLERRFLVTQKRGQWVPSSLAPHVLATVHPSSILRAEDDKSRHEEFLRFVDDLKPVAELLKARKAA